MEIHATHSATICRFNDWAFSTERGEESMKLWNTIPTETDILVTHGPPLGHGDLCVDGHRAGCAALLHAVEERVKPRIHAFGHIHEGYGATTNGETLFLNASNCNVNYNKHKLHPPVYIDVPIPLKEDE